MNILKNNTKGKQGTNQTSENEHILIVEKKESNNLTHCQASLAIHTYPISSRTPRPNRSETFDPGCHWVP